MIKTHAINHRHFKYFVLQSFATFKPRNFFKMKKKDDSIPLQKVDSSTF